ncbi:MAG: YdcF family protein [Patescibacteria group bacterium]
MEKEKPQKAIIILSAGIKKDKNGNWMSTGLVEEKNLSSASGGKARVIAASYIYKDDSENFIIASGGHGSDRNILGIKHPGLSKILKKELIESGVPANKIIEENKSNTTYQQLVELQKIIVEKEIKNIIIISNRYHLPRIQAMIEFGPDLNIFKKMFRASDIELKSAEDVLIKYKPEKWKKIITKVYQSGGMVARIDLEKKGVEQIKKGTYSF